MAIIHKTGGKKKVFFVTNVARAGSISNKFLDVYIATFRCPTRNIFHHISETCLCELGKTCWKTDQPAERKQRQRNKETYVVYRYSE
jgi:hypothetical protein